MAASRLMEGTIISLPAWTGRSLIISDRSNNNGISDRTEVNISE